MKLPLRRTLILFLLLAAGVITEAPAEPKEKIVIKIIVCNAAASTPCNGSSGV
jgi:hypothetical protein